VNRPLSALVAALALAVPLAACGNDSPTTTAATTTTIAANAPKRIVSMSATATEMLFAVGAGKQVIAVDDQSNYPANAPKTDLSAYEPNVEAIAQRKPDLVVIADAGDLKASLEKLGIKVLVEPAAKGVADTYTQLTQLGALTGHTTQAAGVVSRMRAAIAKLVKEVPKRAKPLTYYHELDSTLFSVTSSSFIGALYTLAGLDNVADAADANGQSGGYPQLSAEYLVHADPDLVFLADTKCCAQTADTFAQRPGFGVLAAVKNHHVVNLDDDIASRWGPRIVDFLRKIVDTVKAVPAT
jgi:iron complex transport system substrate-binding protein